MPSTTRLPFSLLITLALTMMLGPFALDTYLPAFPAMASSLGVEQQDIAVTVSVYIFALALGQLVGGALSDHYGRRNVLISGLLLTAVAALLQAKADSLGLLMTGRALQAFGAGWALVSVPALVRDRVAGQQAAKLFSLLGLIMVVAPALAPAVGSALLKLGSWRLIFLFLALYAGLMIPLAAANLAGGRPMGSTATGNKSPFAASLLANYVAVLGNTQALPYIFWQASSFTVMMLFITHASFIYQIHFVQSADAFALLFAANIVAMFAFNLVNRLLLSRLSSLTVLRLGTACQGIGLALLLITVGLEWPLAAFLPSMMIAIGALGAITPNIQACFLDHFPTNSGTAAALMGAAQFGIAGLVSALSAQLPLNLATVVLTMAVCGAIGVAIMLWSLCWRKGR
ncbi:MAG: Bcr/CflA family efflux MFS transporter [Porticoccaceae bacterium]|nr:Bcr/CflA family efflux MFS transporter [Porticoccaceae bacterium]